MNKLVEIFTAWGISFNPNEAQNDRAIKRLAVCESCEFKADHPIKRCTVCGCALKGKVFSPVKDACPKGKWAETDAELPE